MKTQFEVCLVALGLGLISLGCQKRAQQETPVSKKQISLATWSNYVSPETLKSFEEKTGIKVQVTYFSSNEELQAKLQAGATGYDVITPSDYMIFILSKQGLIQKIDKQKLSHLKELDPFLLKREFDQNNEYSVPYTWGTTGIATNTKLIAQPVKSWKELLERKDVAGKFSLLDDAREGMGVAIKALGSSHNTFSDATLEQAKRKLISIRKGVKAFDAEPKSALMSGEVAVAQIYSTDGITAEKESQGWIKYVIPSEGSTLWIDNLAIASGSKAIEEAHQLMDFLISAEVNGAASRKLFVTPSNRTAFEALPAEVKSLPGFKPTEEELSRLEMMKDLKDRSEKIETAWSMVKSAK